MRSFARPSIAGALTQMSKLPSSLILTASFLLFVFTRTLIFISHHKNRTTAPSVRLMRNSERNLTWKSCSRGILHCAVLNILDFLNTLLVSAAAEPRPKPNRDDLFGHFGTEHAAAKG